MSAAGGETALLNVEGLRVDLGGTPALRGVSLSARSGEMVALTGPNGSGKTTMLRTILGLLPAKEGRVLLHGTPVSAMPPRERARRMSWLPQEELPRDNVPLFAYVLYGRYPHLARFAGEAEADRGAAEAAVRAVGLWDRRASGILELSGGERQRALLARALAQATGLLLLDEPTAHLDVGHQLDLLGRVRDLAHGSGTLVVAALHDLNLAARYADRILVLSHGRLVADGPPREVLSEELLLDVWGVAARLRDDPRTGVPYLVPRLPTAAGPRPSARHGVGTVHVVAGGGAGEALLRRLHDAGFRISAGALHLLDSDTQVAEELGIPVAAEAPFAPLGEEARRENRALLDRASAIVVAPFCVGPSNLANLDDLVPYLGRVPIWVLDEPPAAERDFTGGRATRRLEELLGHGARAVRDIDALLSALGAPEPGEAGSPGADGPPPRSG